MATRRIGSFVKFVNTKLLVPLPETTERDIIVLCDSGTVSHRHEAFGLTYCGRTATKACRNLPADTLPTCERCLSTLGVAV